MELYSGNSELYKCDSNEWIDEIFKDYQYHFRIKSIPARFDQLVTFAGWLGLKEKEPTKQTLVEFFLSKNISC
jgi:hypothetical protein